MKYYELRFDPDQPRGKDGKWIAVGGGGSASVSESYGIPKKPSLTLRLTDEELSGKTKSTGNAEKGVDKTDESGIMKPEYDFIDKDFDDLTDKKGQLSNYDVRRWYKAHDKKIPELIDRNQPIENQARQACDLRNKFRTQARELMKDQEMRKSLDITDPNKSFDELLRHKMNDKHLTRDEAIQDIINSATKTRVSVDKSLGLSEE